MGVAKRKQYSTEFKGRVALSAKSSIVLGQVKSRQTAISLDR